MLIADKISQLNGVKLSEYLLTQHNPNKIDMPTEKLIKVTGVTVHNTDDLPGVNDDAEQYTRATYNGNMKTVRVHYYVDDTGIWQNLPLDLSSWHAGDGSGPGNMTTISIECIMNDEESEHNEKAEDNCAKLVAWLLNRYNLTVDSGLFTHLHWNNVRHGKSGTNDYLNTTECSDEKYCPCYILPHWSSFKSKVQSYLNDLKGCKEESIKTTEKSLYRVRKTWEDSSSQIGAFKDLNNAKNVCTEGYSVFDNSGNIMYSKTIPTQTTSNSVIVTSVEKPTITYRVNSGNKWWGEITNYNNSNSNGYAGVECKAVQGLVAKVSSGTLEYRVHTVNGKWWGWIKDYNINNSSTGFAGVLGKNVDAIQFSYNGPSEFKIKYRVSTTDTRNYLSWITGYNETDSMGYAGIFGKPIDKLQVTIEK